MSKFQNEQICQICEARQNTPPPEPCSLTDTCSFLCPIFRLEEVIEGEITIGKCIEFLQTKNSDLKLAFVLETEEEMRTLLSDLRIKNIPSPTTHDGTLYIFLSEEVRK